MSEAFTPSRLTAKPAGFALLITIVLVAFLVLILVGLATFTRVETQIASNGQQLAQARQNALTGLNIALGQLQEAAGPDQRVTATADLAPGADGTALANNAAPINPRADMTPAVPAGANGLGRVQTGTRYWTGVWGNSKTADSLYTEAPAPVLLNWLVSGNESATFRASTASASYGQITESNGTGGTVAPAFTPAGSVANLTHTAAGVLARDITVNDRPAVVLVGPATVAAGASPAASDLDRYVVAPLVPILAAAGSYPGTPATGAASTPVIGQYAYWVGDEGVKTRVNTTDRHVEKTDAQSDPEARYRILVSQRTAAEKITGFNGYDFGLGANAQLVNRVLERQQLSFLPSANLPVTARRNRFHDVTFHSKGLLTNSLRGGLKEDLTYHLEKNTLEGSLLNQPVIPGATTGKNDISPDQGPRWDVIKSYHDLNGSAPVDIRPATTTQMGISPVLVKGVLLVWPVPNGTAGIRIQGRVALALANPYTTPIRIPAGGLDFQILPHNEDRQDGDSNSQMYKNPTDTLHIHFNGISANNAQPGLQNINGNGRVIISARRGSTAAASSLLGNAPFRLPAGDVIQPGQVRIYRMPPGNVTGMTFGGNTPIDLIGGATFSTNGPYFESSPVPATIQPGAWRARMHDDDTRMDIIVTTPGTATTLGAFITGYRRTDTTVGDGGEFDCFPNPQHRSIVFEFISPARGNPNSGGSGDLQADPMDAIFADYNIRGSGFWNPYLSTAGGGAGDNSVGRTRPAGLHLYSDSPNVNTGSYGLFATILNWAGGGPNVPATFFDLPRRSSPSEIALLSIGQLQHASLTGDDFMAGSGDQPGYAVANSWRNPYVARNLSRQARLRAYGSRNDNYFDQSYLLNTALWDGFFFSSIRQDASYSLAAPPDSTILPNGRYKFIPNQALALSGPVAVNPRASASAAARHLIVEGAFNVNSTSVEAWKAFLASSVKLPRPPNSPNGENAKTDAMFPRSLYASGASNASGSQPLGNDPASFTGFRRLSDLECARLAEEIVEQVRLRGPFISVSQFVNRSLGYAARNDTDKLGLAGAVARALDIANINPISARAQDQIYDYRPNGVTRQSIYADFGTTTGLLSLVNTSETRAALGKRSTAIPGWLTQADILQRLGPGISARSDTFIVRAYGETIDVANSGSSPAQTIVTARAWCEAVVQRMPEYLVANDPPETLPTAVTQQANADFGRRFRIVSFRWLTPDDI